MLYALPLIFALAGCQGCDLDGYMPLRVALIHGAPAPALLVDGDCAIYTDLSPEQQNPDSEGAKLVHIGQSVWACLTQTAARGGGYPTPYYEETLWFRIDHGACINERYGCFNYKCRTVDTVLTHIGPSEMGCGAQAAWDETCWNQFYAVLGHEVMHGYLGAFHP